VQVPVYESLSDEEIERVGRLVARQVAAPDNGAAARTERRLTRV
jgi:hypothetical protein